MRQRHCAALLAGALAAATTMATAPPATAGAADGLFHPYDTHAPFTGGEGVAVGDVTGDGRPDVVMTTGYDADPTVAYSLWVYPQRPDGSIGAPVQHKLKATYGSQVTLALGDLNGDGDTDAAVTTPAGVEIYQQIDGGLAFEWTSLPQGAQGLELADVSGDGLVDLVVSTSAGIDVYWQIGGDTMRSPMGSRIGNERVTELEVADVTGDGLADVVSAVADRIEVRAQRPDHSFAAPVVYASGGLDGWDQVAGIGVGDTTGDGLADVHAAVGGNKPNAWVITRRQLDDGTLGEPELRTSYDLPESLEVADVTGDLRNDLVVVHGGWNRVGVYDSTPGTMVTESLYPVPYASHYDPKGLAVGDVTGDGRPDVALGDYNHGLVLLRSAVPGDDPTAPETTITAGPTGTIRSTTATFQFTGTPSPARFECSWGGGAWTNCVSPVTYTGLATGRTHTFAVRGVSSAGLADASPATRSFTVDTAADLALSLTAGPEPVKRGETLTWTAVVDSVGPDAAAWVVYSQGLPAGVSLLSATASTTTSATAQCSDADSSSTMTVRCDLGVMSPGSRWVVTVRATVTASKGTLSSTGVVGTTSWDPHQTNDSASTSTAIGNRGKGR